VVTARDVLDGIKARMVGITQGPWKASQDFIDGGVPDNSMTLNGGGRGGYIGTIALHYDVRASNAEFIAAARTDVARLTGAVEAVLAVGEYNFLDDSYANGYNDALAEVRAAIENALKESQ
jgi:hypothetical protein